MKNIIIVFIAFAFVSCKYVIPFQQEDVFAKWEKYKVECYNDSTFFVKDKNTGLIYADSGVIAFEKDTIWTHKNPDVTEFLNNKN